MFRELFSVYIYLLTFLQIKVVKFYGWEDRWTDRILESREAELKWLWKCQSTCLVRRSSSHWRFNLSPSQQHLVCCRMGQRAYPYFGHFPDNFRHDWS